MKKFSTMAQKFLDEISEEMKREDFLNKVKKNAPYLGILIFLILLGAGLYSWKMYQEEKNLIVYEEKYEKALNLLDEGNGREALKSLEEIEKNCPLLKFSALSLKLTILKGFFPKAFQFEKSDIQQEKEISNLYQRLETQWGNLRSSQSFLDYSKKFFYLSQDLPFSVMEPEKKSVWRPLALMLKTLQAHEDKEAENFLNQWDQSVQNESRSYDEGMKWLVRYVGLGFVFRQNQSPKKILPLIPPKKKVQKFSRKRRRR